ncbi:hypothetical protein AX14_001558 [Amanita brunnescens Koide BX004]|nr:hypothetical protein AX14_001558 [Amanita brunnescens Koide BX004]
MHAVTGPLPTGTYIMEAVDAPGEFGTLNKDQTKFALTKNQSEALQWSVKRLGNDIYRCKMKGSSLTAIHNLEEHNLGIGEGPPTDWIIKELEAPGEYITSPIAHPSLHMSVQRGEGHVSDDGGAKMLIVADANVILG